RHRFCPRRTRRLGPLRQRRRRVPHRSPGGRRRRRRIHRRKQPGAGPPHPTPRTYVMTGNAPDALLVIGSGLKLYREYIVRAIAEQAREDDLRLVLINNLRPTWQLDYFDDITLANVFDHRILADAARQLATRYTISGVMCWDEPLVMPAAELAAEFGLPGLGLDGGHGCHAQ